MDAHKMEACVSGGGDKQKRICDELEVPTTQKNEIRLFPVTKHIQSRPKPLIKCFRKPPPHPPKEQKQMLVTDQIGMGMGKRDM